MAGETLSSISIATLEWMRIETYTNVAAATILAYDCVLTLHTEATLIWPSKFNFVKALFFLTRYMAFIDVSIVLYYQLTPRIDITSCNLAYSISGWFIIVGIIIAEMILIVRTWAIWGMKKMVAFGLGIFFLIACIPALVIEAIFLKSIEFSPLSDPRTPGCLVVAGSPILGIDFIIIIVFETLVLALTLVKGVQYFRVSSSHTFLSILYRDGILFYVYLLAISATNLIVILATPRGLSSTLALIQRVLHSCFSSRLLINLRRANNRDPRSRRSSVATNATHLRNLSSNYQTSPIHGIAGISGSFADMGRNLMDRDDRSELSSHVAVV